MTTESESLALLCVTHRALVFRTCRKILGNDEDAEDATQEVFERATRYLHDKIVEKPSAYLTRVARNTAYEVLKRKLKALETTPLPDDDVVLPRSAPDEARERLTLLAVEQLAEQMKPFLTRAQYKRLQLRIELGAGTISEQQEAAALHIKESSLRATDPATTKVLTEAAIAARMLAEPFDVSEKCESFARLAGDEPPSRTLWKKVEQHIQECQVCARRKTAEKRRIYEALYSLPAFVPMHPGLGTVVALKKSFIAAGLGAAACLTFAAINSGVFATDLPSDAAAPPPTVSVLATPPSAAATSSDVPQPIPAVPTQESPQRTVPSPRPPVQNNAGLATPAPQQPQARNAAPVTILVGDQSIEHRKISPTGCQGPTTSGIRVVIMGDVQSARMIVQLNGRTTAVAMRNVDGTPAWYETVGPYGANVPGGAIKVSVVATDKAGGQAQRDVGVVYLGPCGR